MADSKDVTLYGDVKSIGQRDRERDRAIIDQPRSFSIPWLPKHFASIASMEIHTTQDSKLLDSDNQWRIHNISTILAESFSCFDAHLNTIFQGFKSTSWNFTGHCPECQRIHQHNRWSFTNTPGFPHTTLFTCFSSGNKYLVTRLPF